jgi:hypothetical protein
MVGRHIDPLNHIAYSFTADRRLEHWAVSYDNAIRALAHLCTGEVDKARRTLDYFINNHAIRRVGYILRDGRRLARPGWIVNIVDGAHRRPGHRGVEKTAHTGPNAYLGLAAAHLFTETREPRYLEFARERWSLLKDLQNETAGDPNFGGVRMGPLGPAGSEAQNLEEDARNPSYYEFYNGEHAADFRGLSLLMADVDPANRARYERAAELITVWDRVIWDQDRHLFYIGTTERRYKDNNIGRWVEPGVIPMTPLDTNALKISSYGIDGLEIFGAGTAEALRQAIEDQFRVKVSVNSHHAVGYDFVSHEDRARLVVYEERGPKGFTKVKVGRGREPLLSDEWSTWVALADLRMAADYLAKGETAKAEERIAAYRANACDSALSTAISTEAGDVAYPYAHPLPYALNKPVGFGWNTHHQPFALIGACARILGLSRFDPFLPRGGTFSTKIKV